jgi:hypothetical protein
VASLSDIRERCVEGVSDERPWRRTLFAALTAYLDVTKRVIPAARAWIDGGFMTAKTAAPFDIDIVIMPADWNRFATLDDKGAAALFGALTLQDTIVGSPVLSYLARIQPVSGALDAFLCWPGQEGTWRDTWASVKGADGAIVPGLEKRFAEVTW